MNEEPLRWNVSEVAHKELTSSRTGEKYSLSAVLNELVNIKNIFIHHEILPAYRRASAPHRHTQQDEMIFVLGGYPVAHWGDRQIALKPGDFVGFPSGANEHHFIENPHGSEAEILVIASATPTDQVEFRIF